VPQRQPPGVVDILDRVLDKGVVVIATVGVSVVGLRLIDLDARVVVSSIETYVSQASVIEAVAHARPVDRWSDSTRRHARRRQRRPTIGALVRCSDGCTFARDTMTVTRGSIACPYRRGVSCRLDVT
jgi:hypothetical protein